MSIDLWKELIAESLDEHGVAATADQIAMIAKDAMGIAEGIREFSYQPENPMIAELAESKAAPRQRYGAGEIRMPEQQHTPGLWTARQVGGPGFPGQIGYAIDFNSDQEQVVDFVYEAADARLIAAAPELFAALHYALDTLAHCAADKGYSGMQAKAARMANDAITKAGGKP